LGEDRPEVVLVINVLRSVEGCKDVFARGHAGIGGDGLSFGRGRHQPLYGFHDRVAGKNDPLVRDVLCGEVRDGYVCRRKTDIGQVVRYNTVVFLGHRPIETAKTRLYMSDGDLVGVRSECSGNGGVRITLNDNAQRLDLMEQGVQLGHCGPDLVAPGRPTDRDVVVRGTHSELFEEHIGKRRVVVLPCMDDDSRIPKCVNDPGKFDDLRACAEDDGDRSVREVVRRIVHAVVPVSVLSTLRSVMLRLFVLAAQVPIVLLAAYNAVVALWGWRNAPPAAAGSRSLLVRVVVPAHNEEAVVPALIADLGSQDYPTDRYNVVVIADRSTDGTAAAVVQPARAVERTGGEGGKGAALAWYLEREPLEAAEILVILDADNRVESSFVSLIVAEFEAGATVVQCYLDVANPGVSPLATASALSYWASNRMVQLARSNLGWSCDLGGTGMAFTGDALGDAGGFADDLVEDHALGVRLSLAGHVARWLHHVRVFDEKPSETGVAVTQRARWMAGKRKVARTMAPDVFGAAIRNRSLALGDLGIRMIQPSRTFLALVAAILGIAAALSGSAWLLPWWIWLAVVAVVLVMPIGFLWRDRVPGKYLIQYPLLVILAILWLPIRVASSLVGGRWKPTPHSGGDT